MRYQSTFILVLIPLFSFAQSSKEVTKRFEIDSCIIPLNGIISFPESIDLSKSELSNFEKEKTIYYINYFLRKNPVGLKQAIYRQRLGFQDNKKELFPDLTIALSGYKNNFFNLSFPIAAKYGIEMNETIDMRNDFTSSYMASYKWMNQLSEIFNTQEDILLAFINSPGALKRAKERAKSNEIKDYHQYLPENTKENYFIYQAISYIIKTSTIKKIQQGENKKYIALDVTKDFSLTVFEKVSDESKTLITKLNPVIISDIVPKGHQLILSNKYPFKEIIDSVYFYQDSIMNNPDYGKKKDTSEIELIETYYKVKKGENLIMISQWYDLSVNDIKIWNKLPNDEINSGQVLKLNVNKVNEPDLAKINYLSLEEKNKLLNLTSFLEALKEFEYYTVVSGDALYLIAQKYKGVSADDIMYWNGISPNIQPGQKILIKSK